MSKSTNLVFKVSSAFKLTVIAIFLLLALLYYSSCIVTKTVFIVGLQHNERIQHFVVFEFFFLGFVYMIKSFTQTISINEFFFRSADFFSSKKVSLNDIGGYYITYGYSEPMPFYRLPWYNLVDNNANCLFTVADLPWPKRFGNQSKLIFWIETLREIEPSPGFFVKMRMSGFFAICALIFFSMPLQIILLDMIP